VLGQRAAALLENSEFGALFNPNSHSGPLRCRSGGIASLLASPVLVAAEDAVLSNSGLAVSFNLEWSRGLTQRVDLKTGKGKMLPI
jgi:hypothetical protein